MGGSAIVLETKRKKERFRTGLTWLLNYNQFQDPLFHIKWSSINRELVSRWGNSKSFKIKDIVFIFVMNGEITEGCNTGGKLYTG